MADIVLLNTTYQILSRDQFGYLWIQYTLDTIPPDSWNKIFSRQSSSLSIYHLKSTNQVLVYLTPFELSEEEIEKEKRAQKLVKELGISIEQARNQSYGFVTDSVILVIDQTNEEISSDLLKVSIILSNFAGGMIVVHDGMHYTALRVPEITIDDKQFNRDHYESYVNRIAARL